MIQPLDIESASLEVNNAIPDDQVVVPSQAGPQVSNPGSSFDINDPRQCMEDINQSHDLVVDVTDDDMSNELYELYDFALFVVAGNVGWDVTN
ncbi:hypothetical protein RIF29_25346 [Crotalaria pallida]|uniref:Uncharacterized protein n=1 Tax=Crotalaria pallida TaxID=3830 RepID=A0AAN9HXE2_CROPI